MKNIVGVLLVTLLCLQQANACGCKRPPLKHQPDRGCIVTPAPITQSNYFTLSGQWACRQGVTFKSCRGSVLWNNVVVQSIRPCNYGVNTFSVRVQAAIGQNVLQLRGEGNSDSFGLTVDNVRLVRHGQNQDIVVNGGFEDPCITGGWKIFNRIPGWIGHQIEIGAGKIYNSQWYSQVCELDGNRNSKIAQYFNFDGNYNLIGDAGNSCACDCHC